jgi:hypothetical protein
LSANVQHLQDFHSEDSPPKIQTATTQTTKAIIPPLDNVMDPESGPLAPAIEPAALLPGALAASPGEGPLPGCSGAEVANAEK